jgi:hypothetical protein
MIIIYSRDFERHLGGKALKLKDEYMHMHPSENDFRYQGWIYKEIRCALRDGFNNSINGVLVVMPDEI